MILGYNTNGFAHHRLGDAIRIITELGYGGIALTPDVHHMDPFASNETHAVDRADIEHRHLRCVIETGARFILDPWRKHQPTLFSFREPGNGSQARMRFLMKAVRLASEMLADCVSFWSGVPTDSASPSEYMDRLVEGCK